MYRLSEEVAYKILKNIRNPEIGPMEITQADPFMPKNLNSIGLIDPYCCVGSDFRYLLEVPFPYINTTLPNIQGLNGYWLYKREELFAPMQSFNVPLYLADPNVNNCDDMIDVADCSLTLPEEWKKLSATSIFTFEALIKNEPLLLDCLHKDLK